MELREASRLVIEALEFLHDSYREIERMASDHLDGSEVSQVAWDGVLGSWALHARKLIHFIGGPGQVRADDILAEDFMARDSAWPTARTGLLQLDDLPNRVGKELAHLVYPSARKDEGWEVGTATRELTRAMTVFVAHAPPNHLRPDFAARTAEVATELVYLDPKRIEPT